MQNYPRFMLRQIKLINNNIHRGFYQYMSLFQKRINHRTYDYSTIIKTRYLSSQDVPIASIIKQKSGILNINDLKQYINKGKQFYLKLLTNILDSLDFANISHEDAELLLECCGQSVADSSKQKRNDVCQKIFKNLVEQNILNQNIFHTYIKVCTENGILLNSTEFLASFKLDPNSKTYKLLLSNVCEKGDISQAHKLLNLMKDNGISADEDIFNKLVLAYTSHDGLKAGESVLLTMRTARIPETAETKFSILKGVVKRGSVEDFEIVLSKYKLDITEPYLFELLEIISLKENITWLPKMQNLLNINISREFLNALEKLCIHLVHMGKPESAMIIYKNFVKPATDNYAFFLLKEMLHCNIDISRIISIAIQLRDENLNKYTVENLTEIALKHNYTTESWKLIENLGTLRAHFFWPLLIQINNAEGEKGVFDALKKMITMNVKIDSETLEFYVLPFCDLNNFKFLIKKFFDLGIRVKEILSPMLIVLLRNNKLKEAADLCNNYDVRISGNNFINLLSHAWIATRDTKSVILLVQRYCEANLTGTDMVGDFLIKTLNSCRIKEDFTQYLGLIELIHERKLSIDSTSATILHNICSVTCKSSDIAEKIRDQIDSLLSFELKSETPHITHPKNMKLEELECHLLELQEKNMETRGVLRKLIQLHANFGNVQRVEELKQQFVNSGYEESIGMKSSLMHSYVMGGYLESALNMYKEVKNSNTNFRLDDFKVIDLITLLIKEDRFREAMDIIHTETKSKKVIGGAGIERNCWELLRSFKNEDEQLQMFNFLIANGYCKPTNVLLGPLVRIHLSRGDLQKAADVFIDCAKKYKRTPLQLEIVCAALKSEDEDLLQNILTAAKEVHGVPSTQAILITALAENGQEKALTKLLTNNKISCKKELEGKCERWIQEGKVEALQILAKACQRVSEKVIDINFVYNCIMQTFILSCDIEGATKFYEKLLETDSMLNKDLQEQLNKMLKKGSSTTKKSLYCS